MSNNKQQLYIAKRGFTLLETLIAIFIFVLAVTAILSLVGDSVNNTSSLKDTITASYLADEAMDYIRNDRDTISFQHQYNGSQNGDWSTFNAKYSGCFTSDGCELDMFADYVQQCQNGLCTPIRFFTGAAQKYYGFFGPAMNGDITTFERKIRFVYPANASDKFVMIVTVSWKNKTGYTRQKVYIGALYNWGA